MATILDTNALSAFVDGNEKLLRVIEKESELELPVIVLGEYLYCSPSFKKLRRVTSDIRHALKAAGAPIPSNDLWIAAVARQHRMWLVTRDSHFRATPGLRILTW